MSTREGIDRLRDAAPPGHPGENQLTGFVSGTWREASWMSDIVLDLCGTDLFPGPPYCARWMFGDSDREWLERVHRSYQLALKEGLRDEPDGHSDEIRKRVEDRVRPPYRELVRDIAQARLAASPELSVRFDDPRSLKDLAVRPPSGDRDPQYCFLANLMDAVLPVDAFKVGLDDLADKHYFAATDLPELVLLRSEVAQAYRSVHERVLTSEEETRLLRPFAERLHVLLEAKRERKERRRAEERVYYELKDGGHVLGVLSSDGTLTVVRRVRLGIGTSGPRMARGEEVTKVEWPEDSRATRDE